MPSWRIESTLCSVLQQLGPSWRVISEGDTPAAHLSYVPSFVKGHALGLTELLKPW